MNRSQLKKYEKKGKEKKAKKIFKIPIVGIGGINSNNYKILLKNGVNYIAVSGFIWRNKNISPIEAIKKFK